MQRFGLVGLMAFAMAGMCARADDGNPAPDPFIVAVHRIGAPDGTKDTADPGAEKPLFCVGETLRVTLKVTNNGPDAAALVACSLVDHASRGFSYACYDSHNPARTPSGKAEDAARQVRRGETVYVSFDYPLPAYAATGTYTLHATVLDGSRATQPPPAADLAQPPPAPAPQDPPPQGAVLGRLVRSDAFSVWAHAVAVPILMYHWIDPRPNIPYSITPSLLEQHLQALKAYGYTPVHLEDLLKFRAGAKPPERPVVITFDDGHLDNRDLGVPILTRLGFTATFFIIASKPDIGWDGKARFIPWSGLAAMRDAGFEMASHTVSHPHMTELSAERRRQELVESKATIEKHLGAGTARFLSWPFGQGGSLNPADADDQAAARDAGYHGAVADRGGVENTGTCNPWALKRVPIWSTHSLTLTHPKGADFFMKAVDPGFPIPTLGLDAPEFEDAAGVARTTFAPGERVIVKFVCRNLGQGVDVVASLQAAPSQETARPFYDSHAAGADAEKTHIGRDAAVLRFAWTVPADAPAGPCALKADLYDGFHLLLFKPGAWSEGFSVVRK